VRNRIDAPSLVTGKEFLPFYIATSHGNIVEQLTTHSVSTVAGRLFGGFTRVMVVLGSVLAYLAFRQTHAHELECLPPACRLNMVEATATWRHEDGRMDRSSH
jgi:hypothetical protein